MVFVSQNEISNAMQVNAWEITDVITPELAIEIGKKLEVHEIWIGQITQIIAEDPQYTSTTEDVTASVKVGEETYINKKGKEKKRNVYADKTARVRKKSKMAMGRVNGSYQIINTETGQASGLETFSEDKVYTHSWVEYVSGNKDAASQHGAGGRDKHLPGPGERINYRKYCNRELPIFYILLFSL